MSTIESGMKLGAVLTALGLLGAVQNPWTSRLFAPTENESARFGKVMRHVRMRIEGRLRRGGADERRDMLALFVRQGLTADELVTESLLQLVAGTDTTATAIRSTMLYLLTHPRVYARLQAEIGEAVAASRAPPVPAVVADAEVKALPYLQAVVKEGMRIHPPAAGVFPKRVPDGGDTVVVDGKPVFLPGGTNVGCAMFPLHRDKRVYGEDADEFRPERWLLEKDEAKLALMNKTQELIFGYGRYQCLGKPIALMEVGKAVFEASNPGDYISLLCTVMGT